MIGHEPMPIFTYILQRNRPVEENIIETFHQIIRESFAPRARSFPELAQFEHQRIAPPLNENRDQVQIIIRDFSAVHWTCARYRNHTLRIYDSKYRDLTKHQQERLGRIFPTVRYEDISFAICQKQNNSYENGLFAIAYATSIALGDDPSYLLYDVDKMRPHLFNMLSNRRLMRFPAIVYDHVMEEEKARAKKLAKARAKKAKLPVDVCMEENMDCQQTKRKPVGSTSEEQSVSKKPCTASDQAHYVPEAMETEENAQQEPSGGMEFCY